MTFDAEKQRLDFPILNQLIQGQSFIYFDSAATAQKPRCVIDAMSKFYTSEYATVHRAVYEYARAATEKYAGVRRLAQEFIGAKSENEIIFTRGTTESINLIAQCFGKVHVQRGDEILITEMEHHSNIVPWQFLCEYTGAKLVVAPINDQGEIILEEFQKKLSAKTKLVSFCHISNALGTINPAQELIAMAHNVGAKVVVDGAQSVPHLPIDVVALDADFYAFSGHKCYGPTGIGILYGKEELLDQMNPYHGGGDMVQEVTFAKTVVQPPPLKFEAGTPPVAEVIGLGAALQYLTQLDRLAAGRHELMLLKKAEEKMQEIPGATIYGRAKEKGPLISFQIEGVHCFDLGSLLSLKGVAMRTGTLCAQPAINHFGRETLARISFGLYNTEREVDLFFDRLMSCLSLLAGTVGTVKN